MGKIRLIIYFVFYLLTFNIYVSDSIDIVKDLKKIFYDIDPRPHPRKHDPTPKKTTEDVIREAGYVAERHEIRTEDNYWLIVHRIPRGKGQKPSVNKPVVILAHGLLCNSVLWAVNTPEDSLGFVLADQGYDVWMPNVRGNTYSRRHEFLDPVKDAPRFWNFSFHEMGYYDMAATIDYALDATGQSQVFYIGHSLGTTLSYVLLSTRPEYNDKIKAVFSLAPVAFMGQMDKILDRVSNQIETHLLDVLTDYGIYEILPQSKWTDFINEHMCKNRVTFWLCEFYLGYKNGFDFGETDSVKLNSLMKYTPSGTSVKIYLHFLQLMNERKFNQYDYGWGGNYQQYGKITPPDYELTKITAPVIIFSAHNDKVADRKDVDKLFDLLPHIVGKIIIKKESFNHVDFVLGKHVKTLVFDVLVDIINRYKKYGYVDKDYFKKYEETKEIYIE